MLEVGIIIVKTPRKREHSNLGTAFVMIYMYICGYMPTHILEMCK